MMDKAESYSLHVFGDASEKAFCTIVYVVMKVHSAYHPRLITNKSRVALIKPLTMPRMELLAALISARLLNTVRQALENQVSFESIHCRSDSITVLYWLKDDRSYKEIVKNLPVNIDEVHETDSDKIIDIARYSSCNRLLRVTVLVL